MDLDGKEKSALFRWLVSKSKCKMRLLGLGVGMHSTPCHKSFPYWLVRPRVYIIFEKTLIEVKKGKVKRRFNPQESMTTGQRERDTLTSQLQGPVFDPQPLVHSVYSPSVYGFLLEAWTSSHSPQTYNQVV